MRDVTNSPGTRTFSQLTARTGEVTPETIGFNLGSAGVIRSGSTPDLVLQFLRAHDGRFVRHDDLVQGTGRGNKELNWALFWLKAKGKIDAVGDPRSTKFLRYRPSQVVRDASASTKLRHVKDQLPLVNAEVATATHAHVLPKEGVEGDVVSAALLESWLVGYCKSRNADTVATRDVLRCGPGKLRDKASLTGALTELVTLGRVTLIRDGRKNVVKINAEPSFPLLN